MMNAERRQSGDEGVAASIYDGEISKLDVEASATSAASAAASTITAPIVSIFPVTQTVDGSEQVHAATITLFPAAGATAASGSHHGLNSGKTAGIAVGSAVGAILLALLGLLLWRRRAVRSSSHWRNRMHGGWQDLEGKRAIPVDNHASASAYPADVKRPIELDTAQVSRVDPMAPTFTRAPRRPSNPYTDTPTHKRSDSGYAPPSVATAY